MQSFQANQSNISQRKKSNEQKKKEERKESSLDRETETLIHSSLFHFHSSLKGGGREMGKET